MNFTADQGKRHHWRRCPGQIRCAVAILLSACLVLLGACAVNPVTGEKELGLVTPAQEISIGQKQYVPSQQSQGGPYTLDAGLSAYVREVGLRLAKVSDRPELPYGFVVLNASVPNAWALPGGKIALNRGLLVHLRDESELAAVLAHEIVHAAARHGAQQMEQGMLLGTGLQILGAATSQTAYRDVILQSAGLGSALIQTRYGRGAELEADTYGMRYMAAAGYNPLGAVMLQETFVKLSEDKQSDWLSGLFASHPPSAARVAANRRTAAQLSSAGERGESRYLAKTAKLRRDRKAYDTYDQAVQYLANKEYKLALDSADRAIATLRSESLFHEIRGMSLRSLEQDQKALDAYDQAVRRNNGFFRHLLLRGLLHSKHGQNALAEQDLLAANRLLPTAQASYALGELKLAAGHRQRAAAYFTEVAESNSPLAASAREQLQRLSSGNR